MTSYTARNWIVRDLPFGTLDGYPLVEADIPNAHIVTMVSPAADALDYHGVTNVFYTDLEQEVAGLDTNYGSTGLKAAAEDFVLPDGTEVKVGALVFTVTRMDMEAGTMTTLFEKL